MSAILAFAFFMTSVYQHENHLFGVLPFLAIVWIFDKRLAFIYVILTLSLLFNMISHDPFIMSKCISFPSRGYLLIVLFFCKTPLLIANKSFSVWSWLFLIGINIIVNIITLIYSIYLILLSNIHTKIAKNKIFIRANASKHNLIYITVSLFILSLLISTYILVKFNPSASQFLRIVLTTREIF